MGGTPRSQAGGCWSSYTPRLLLAHQTIQALDDMLQALVMEDMEPNMPILQNFLEVGGCRSQGN